MNSETLQYVEVLCKYFLSESVSETAEEFLKLRRSSKSSLCDSIKSFHDISVCVYIFHLVQNKNVSIFENHVTDFLP